MAETWQGLKVASEAGIRSRFGAFWLPLDTLRYYTYDDMLAILDGCIVTSACGEYLPSNKPDTNDYAPFVRYYAWHPEFAVVELGQKPKRYRPILEGGKRTWEPLGD